MKHMKIFETKPRNFMKKFKDFWKDFRDRHKNLINFQ